MNPDPTSLDRLHDIVAPPPVPLWPPAPAWYWVIGFLLAVVLVLVLRALLRWQHNRYRREALAELPRQQSALDDPGRRAAAVAAIAELLKRAALSAWPREDVASLIGPPWLNFLDHTGRTKSFSSGPGEWLERISYDPREAGSLSAGQVRELIPLVRNWLAHHRVGTPPRPQNDDEESRTSTKDEDEI